MTSLFDLFSTSLGISDLWSASLLSIKERMEYLSSSLLTGSWVYNLQIALAHENIESHNNCRIVESLYNPQEKTWTLQTEQGNFYGRQLIVAQSPWESVEWLDQKACSTYFLSLAQKFQPVSLVTLSYRLPVELDLPALLWIMAEDVQAVKNHPLELCLQAVVDYEHSLEAPNVVKAIKRLKRSFKRIVQYTGLDTSTVKEEFLALHRDAAIAHGGAQK